jgi:hypothetical protein
MPAKQSVYNCDGKKKFKKKKHVNELGAIKDHHMPLINSSF